MKQHFDDPQPEANHQENESEPEEAAGWEQPPADDLAELEVLEAEAAAAYLKLSSEKPEQSTERIVPTIEQIMKDITETSEQATKGGV